MTYSGINVALFSTNFFIQFPFLWRITLYPQMLMPPAAYIYVRAILNQQVRFKKTDMLILLPILLYAIHFYPVYTMPLVEKRELIKNLLSNKSLIALEVDGLLPNKLGLSLRMLYSLAFAIAQSRMLYSWKRKLKTQGDLALQNKEMLKWLSFFTWVVILIFILLVATTFWQNQSSLNLFLVISAVALIGAISICIYLISKPNILYGLRGWLQTIEINNTTTLLPTDKERFQKKISSHFKINNSFIQPDFNLIDLANEIGESPSLTMTFINQEYGKSFEDFLYDLRIGYMNNQILNNPLWKTYSNEARSKMAGFKSGFLIPSTWRLRKSIDKISVCLEVEVSYSTRFQIWYRNARNKPKVKQIKGRKFSTCIKRPKKDSRIELLALVSNPKEIEKQYVSLTISIDNKKIETLSFPIETNQTYSEWHKIAIDYFVDEKINSINV